MYGEKSIKILVGHLSAYKCIIMIMHIFLMLQLFTNQNDFYPNCCSKASNTETSKAISMSNQLILFFHKVSFFPICAKTSTIHVLLSLLSMQHVLQFNPCSPLHATCAAIQPMFTSSCNMSCNSTHAHLSMQHVLQFNPCSPLHAT